MSESNVRVVAWMPYDETDGRVEVAIGGLGGWFGRDETHTWSDYFDDWGDELKPYVLALRDEIVRLGIREGGDWHQNSNEGVPVFSDGTVALYSYRAWGDLLAAVWESVDHLPYSYMSFYMSPGATAEGVREDMRNRPQMYGTKEERAAWREASLASFIGPTPTAEPPTDSKKTEP